MQTVKNKLWKKAEDKHLALLDYCTTPQEGLHLSPAQLLMGKRPHNKLPAKRSLLVPKPYSFQEIKRHFDMEKTKQKLYHDRVAQEWPPFKGRQVRMEPLPGTRKWVPGEIIQKHKSPRSFVLQAGNRLFRRNRQHLWSSNKLANHTPCVRARDGKLGQWWTQRYFLPFSYQQWWSVQCFSFAPFPF